MENQTPLTTLRPFDAEKSKNGAIVVTEKGETVEIFKYDLKRNGEEFIIALVTHTQESTLCLYHQDGRVFEPYRINGFTSDLRIKPTMREGWVNVYYDLIKGRETGSLYSTKDEAIENISNSKHYITTAFVEWKE